MGKSIEQLRDEYIAKKLEGNTLPYGMEYLNLLSKFVEEADALYPMPTETDENGKPLTYWGGKQTEKKQSSVEWLIAELFKIQTQYVNSRYDQKEMSVFEYSSLKDQAEKQAKAMHRKETCQFAVDWFQNCPIGGDVNDPKCAQKYYNETFGE